VEKGYLEGGLAYSQIKNELYELLEAEFSEARERYGEYIQDLEYLDQVLLQGAEKARKLSIPKIAKVRAALGID
jgi:tryptophanyl-tRNA synthetase